MEPGEEVVSRIKLIKIQIYHVQFFDYFFPQNIIIIRGNVNKINILLFL